MPCAYKKVDKQNDDLFKRGYAKGTKFTAKAKTATGVEFSAEATSNKDKYASKLSAKFKHAASGFSVDKFEIDTKGGKGGLMTSEVSMKEPSMPGTRFTLKTVIANKDEYAKEMAEIGVEYSDKMMLTHVTVDPVNLTGSVNAVMNTQGCLVGAELNATKEAGATGFLAPLGFNSCGSMLFGYQGGDYKAVVRGSNNFGCKFSLYNQYSNNLQLSTEVNFNAMAVLGNGDSLAGMGVTGALKYKIDSDTAFQAKASQSVVSLSYTQKLSPKLKFTASTTVNLKMEEDNQLSPYTGLGMQFDFGDI